MTKKSKNEVEEILQQYPEARNNDFFLCWMWLQKFGGLSLPVLEQSQLNELNGKLSTLTRWRRKIQGDGKLLPTRKDIDHRRNGIKKDGHFNEV
jgi:hypothetical protein